MTDQTNAPAGAPAGESTAATAGGGVTTVASSLLGGTQAPAAGTEGAPAAGGEQGAAGADPAKAGGDGGGEGNQGDTLALPGKDATPEEWAEFYAKIGRPETPEGYELPVPEGDDGAFAKQMAPILHKHGITAEQAKGLANDWNALVAAQQAEAAKAEQAEIARLDQQNKAEATELRNEWGAQHDANMHFAKLAAQQFFPAEHAPAVISAIESVLGYKATIQMLHTIGKGLGEHDAAGLGGNGGGAAPKSAAERLYGSSMSSVAG